MVKKGSLVRFTGKDRVIPEGKHLGVHDVKGDVAVVWWHLFDKGKWTKKTVKISDLEEVVE